MTEDMHRQRLTSHPVVDRELVSLRPIDTFGPDASLLRSLTSFIGRESEISAVQVMLDDEHTRLLTLIGPGGVGKTRLALEVARLVVW